MLGNRFTSEPNFFVCAVSDQKTRLIFQRNIIDFLHFIFTASPISVYSCFKSCFVRICGILMFSFISLYWCSLFYMPVFRPFYSSIWRSCETAELIRYVRGTPGGRMRISTAPEQKKESTDNSDHPGFEKDGRFA